MEHLEVHEMFVSIQGESTFAGRPCAFVRLKGCPLRCAWCDTVYAYREGLKTPVGEIVRRVVSENVPLVEVTGGEPLAQAGTLPLLEALCDEGLTVLLETNGAEDISPVDPRVHIIMDIKCPSSGMTQRMLWENIDLLKEKDEIKFVVGGRVDYEFARELIHGRRLDQKCTVLLSAVFGSVVPRAVVSWMLEDRLPARFQLQMQKFIWAPNTRGV
jgi:7-carboxy-7-deazaguanine synthase